MRLTSRPIRSTSINNARRPQVALSLPLGVGIIDGVVSVVPRTLQGVLNGALGGGQS